MQLFDAVSHLIYAREACEDLLGFGSFGAAAAKLGVTPEDARVNGCSKLGSPESADPILSVRGQLLKLVEDAAAYGQHLIVVHEVN